MKHLNGNHLFGKITFKYIKKYYFFYRFHWNPDETIIENDDFFSIFIATHLIASHLISFRVWKEKSDEVKKKLRIRDETVNSSSENVLNNVFIVFMSQTQSAEQKKCMRFFFVSLILLPSIARHTFRSAQEPNREHVKQSSFYVLTSLYWNVCDSKQKSHFFKVEYWILRSIHNSHAYTQTIECGFLIS